MIRPARSHDIPAVIDVWLAASRHAHDFVPYGYWLERAVDMRDRYLPHSETHVLEVDGRVLGFVSLVEDRLAALFVAPGVQGRGFGRALLALAKEKRRSLFLQVYKDNERAVRFYRTAGFTAVEERVDPETSCVELRMEWQQAAGPATRTGHA